MNEKELIQKFLDNRCTKEEGIIVQRLLESDPKVLDEFLNQREWDETSNDDKEEDAELRSEIWQGVRSGTKRNLLCSWLARSAAVAASILLVISMWFFYSRNHRSQPQESISAEVFSDSVRLEQNNSAQIQRLVLADGSVVTLYPGSSIRYSTNFRENRKIRLIGGRAAFEVAKDRVHPFVVLSGDISTTALGTKFIVDQSEGSINVRLYEGKVVVKHLEKDTERQPTFLSPGEQCVINIKEGSVTIASLKNERFGDVLQKNRLVEAKEEIPANGLKFDNEPLKDAFEQLEKAFNKHIEYNAGDVATIYFTGEFSASDSLDHILNTLTKANGLIVQNEQGIINVIKSSEPASKELVRGRGTTGKRLKMATDKEAYSRYENASLGQVFGELEKKFGVVIEFDKAGIRNKYFTGLISSKDDIGTILSIICKMNDLRLVSNAKGYSIMK